MRAPLTLACCAIWAAISGCDQAAENDSATTSITAAPRQVVALGRLEPAGGIISISALPGEKLKSFAPGVKPGAQVAAGAELARTESFDLRQAQVEAADLKLETARKQRDQERIAATAQLDQALAAQSQAEAKYQETLAQQDQLQNLGEAAAIAQEDLAQLERLAASDVELITDQQLRRRRNAAQRAAQEYEAAAAAYPHALEAAKKAVEAAAANVALARENLELLSQVDQTAVAELEKRVAEETRAQSILRAPKVEGGSTEFTVLRTMVQPGELISQLPVLEIGDLSKMVAIAEVFEADAKELSVGQKARIRSAAFAGKYANGAADGGGIPGTVTHIGAMVASPGLTNRNPLAPADRSVVEVRVAIDPADAEATAEAARRVGLQVTVEFGEKPDAPPRPAEP
ncbi:MAG TPA: efflux RND transporter periplasmic adaptor subunit [Lacipirellula sp.]